jgi:hypothetical protein
MAAWPSLAARFCRVDQNLKFFFGAEPLRGLKKLDVLTRIVVGVGAKVFLVEV